MPLAALLIEDSAPIRKTLVPLLEEFANLEVIAEATTAAEAMAALRTHADTWRLVILDLFLRQGNGIEIARALADRRPDQHVLLITNYLTPEIRRRSLDAGVDGVYDKSTEIEPFLDHCRSYSAA
ncbi:MAG: response regulator [Caldimonas sp.]